MEKLKHMDTTGKAIKWYKYYQKKKKKKARRILKLQRADCLRFALTTSIRGLSKAAETQV